MASDYRAPAASEKPKYKIGWLQERVATGQAFLESQRAWRDIDRAYEIIASDDDDKIPDTQSHLRLNYVKRGIKEIVSTLSNLRGFSSYQTQNSELYNQNVVLNKLAQWWWFDSMADRQLRKCLQFAAVASTGYLSLGLQRERYATGDSNLILTALGPKSVVPFGLGPDHDLQRAYLVDIVEEVPLHQAHAEYPEFQDLINADRGEPGWIAKGLAYVQKFTGSAWDAVGARGREERKGQYPTVDIHKTYILDGTVNTTGRRIPMGYPGSSWYYEVPSLGDDIPTGTYNAAGQLLYTKAIEKDCLMYPLRRLVKWTSSCLLYDDTSPWWSGKVPIVKFTLDDWPWEYLGHSLVMDAYPIQDSLIKLYRAIDDAANLRLNPPRAVDTSGTSDASKSWAEVFDMRSPGETAPFNSLMGEIPVKPLLDPSNYDIPAAILEHIKTLKEDLLYQMGLPDVRALAQAKQMPASDSQQKYLELIGPVVQDMTRNMEAGIRDLGNILLPEFFQFFPTGKKLRVLGAGNVTEEEYDYDPGNMIPSHLPGEDKTHESRLNMVERARWWSSHFEFHVQPNSLHQITQMSHKLLYIQLLKLGDKFPIDPWTLAKVMDIPDFGPLPKDEQGRELQTIVERWTYWTGILHNMQIALAQDTQQQMQGGGGGKPNGQGRGRPPIIQGNPSIKQKDGGSRSTITG